MQDISFHGIRQPSLVQELAQGCQGWLLLVLEDANLQFALIGIAEGWAVTHGIHADGHTMDQIPVAKAGGQDLLAADPIHDGKDDRLFSDQPCHHIQR